MNYEKLFSVSFYHEYYRSRKFNGFSVKATPETNRLLKAYGMLMRQSGAEFALFYKEESEGKSLLRKLRQGIQLSFFIESKDRIFTNYSKISEGVNCSGYRLTNRNDNPADQSILHKGPFLAETDCVQFISTLAELIADVAQDAAMQIENAFGVTLFEGTSNSLHEGLFRDLCEAGYLKVICNGESHEYYCKPSGIRHMVGVIDIVVNPEGEEKCTFDSVEGTDYKIIIDSMSVTWKYNLINRDEYKYADFKIYSGKKIVPTTAAKEKVMINGEKAYYIETTMPLQLKERYENGLELEMIKIETDRNIKKRINLPVPDIRKVKVAREDDTYRAYSEMYIYF